MLARTLTAVHRQHQRHLSTSILTALNKWISSPKSLTLTDTLTPTHLADLYITLPTRDGTRTHPDGRPYAPPPSEGTPLSYGHHLAFFHPRNPEAELRADGTDAEFCPPEPFTRRMWVGGTMAWPGGALDHHMLKVGEKARAVSTIASVEKKGFQQGLTNSNPMVFVKQRIEVTAEGRTEPSVIEERSHVYLASAGSKREARQVHGLPNPEFTFSYKPSPTTLFRFSALTFNGHYIHLDRDYAQKSEGYSERLVHGPLTALMLLETLLFHHPTLRLCTFDYRARNPVIVNRTSTIYGAITGENTADMWCADEDGVVGMTAVVTFTRRALR